MLFSSSSGSSDTKKICSKKNEKSTKLQKTQKLRNRKIVKIAKYIVRSKCFTEVLNNYKADSFTNTQNHEYILACEQTKQKQYEAQMTAEQSKQKEYEFRLLSSMLFFVIV